MFWVLLSGWLETRTQKHQKRITYTKYIKKLFFIYGRIICLRSFQQQMLSPDPSLLLGCPQLSQINEDLNYFSYKCGVRDTALPEAVPIRPGVLKTEDV